MPAIYLDSAASTRPDDEVLAVMALVARQEFGNPSSAHAAGASAARVLEQARQELAQVIGASQPSEITFTSGGTESNAMAILGGALRSRGRHLVVGALEHAAVLRNADRLVRQHGFEMTVVPADSTGVVTPQAVLAGLRPDTAVVAVMLVNNEIGTVQPITEIANAIGLRARDDGRRAPHFHVDAVQALGLLPFRAQTLGADSLAFSAHKIHGPKGVGALWLRAGARLDAVWEGGGQERGARSGSENLPGIAGLARAATLAARCRTTGGVARMAELRDHFESRVRELVPDATATIAHGARAPHIASLSFPGLPAEPLLHALGARGVMASAGSACASKVRGPSHVLKAMGVSDDAAVLRFSLSRETTPDEIELATTALVAAIAEISQTVNPHRRRANRALVKPTGTG